MSRGPFHVCVECTPHHFDDCPACFGVGLYVTESGDTYPVLVRHAAEHTLSYPVVRCDVCGSDERGVYHAV